MVEKTNLHMKVGQYRLILEFIVCESLSAACIIGANFCDKVVIAIRHQDGKIQLTDGTRVPILRDSDTTYPRDNPVAVKDKEG